MERLDSLKGRFSASDIARGKVTEEQRLLQYYEQFKDNDTKYIVKTMENIDGTLDADLINSDLESYKGISMVIIDGFNLMAHKGSGSNRDKMSSTSRQLRRVFAKHNVVGIVVHQTPTSAKKENEAVDDLGDRIPSPAKIHQYSETIAVVQDACTVLSYDYSNGIGKILIAKARKPCVDDEIDLIVDYKNGYIVDKLHMASNMPLNF
jgi:replicative DNA helicase